MSNLTSASNEASHVSSSSNINESVGILYPTLNQPAQAPHPIKKKRNQPGNPDPDAEVIALSPRTLMATNRFLCEICNKGFQRDQNLQLHKRGHNLPWKLKQRTSNETRKKVYVCPETSCVHNDPSRALGDLTGVKKHFSRKHGEKRWKCDKCSKKYAVQSDLKAHSKTCGTREYRCDCGNIFSRRDSFITHRAFCDALAQESTRSSSINVINNNMQLQQGQVQFMNNNNNNNNNAQYNKFQFPIKKEQQSFNLIRPDQINPPWLDPPHLDLTTLPTYHHHHNPSASPHILSATALLQKAAEQMGAAASPAGVFIIPSHDHQTHYHHVSSASAGGGGESESGHSTTLINSLSSYENKAAATVPMTGGISNSPCCSSNLLHDMIMMNNIHHLPLSSHGFDGSTTFDQDISAFHGIMKDDNQSIHFDATINGQFSSSSSRSTRGNEQGTGDHGMATTTRDFLGLRTNLMTTQSDHDMLLTMQAAGFCNDNHNQNQKSWQGN